MPKLPISKTYKFNRTHFMECIRKDPKYLLTDQKKTGQKRDAEDNPKKRSTNCNKPWIKIVFSSDKR